MTNHTKTSMRYCPDCKAPNPRGAAECFACGQRLNEQVPDPPRPGERTAVCLNCRKPYRMSAEACPGCGRSTAGLQPGSPTVVRAGESAPAGWTAELLSDGSVKLRRNVWRRAVEDATAPAICLLFGSIFLGLGSASNQHRGLPTAPLVLPHLLGASVLLLGLAAAVWQFGAREDIRVGPAFFERTEVLGPLARRWRFDAAAVIRAETNQGSDRTGSYTRRRLLIENLGRKMTLERHFRRDSLLSFGGPAPVVDDDIAALGRYVSEITGWPFVDSARGV